MGHGGQVARGKARQFLPVYDQKVKDLANPDGGLYWEPLYDLLADDETRRHHRGDLCGGAGAGHASSPDRRGPVDALHTRSRPSPPTAAPSGGDRRRPIVTVGIPASSNEAWPPRAGLSGDMFRPSREPARKRIGLVGWSRRSTPARVRLGISTLQRCSPDGVGGSNDPATPGGSCGPNAGTVGPDEVLGPYDETLTDVGRSARRQWSQGVLDQLTAEFEDVRALAFEIHAGSDYRDFGLVEGLAQAGARVEVPAVGGSVKGSKSPSTPVLPLSRLCPRRS